MKIGIEHDMYGNLHRASVYAMGVYHFSLGLSREEAKHKLVAKLKRQLRTSPSKVREVEEVEI